MTDGTTAPLDEIRGLVAERGRYDGWLATLEARRAATPAHVFARVWQDYDGRRRAVSETLAGHAGALRESEAALARRHDEMARTLGERRDALAEVELRALVGEFDAATETRLRDEAQAAIAALDGELDALATQLAEVRDLLGQVQGAAIATPAGGESAPAPGGEGEPLPRLTPSAGEAAIDAALTPVRTTPVGAVPSVAAVPAVGDTDGATLAGDTASGHHYAPPLGGEVQPARAEGAPPLAGQRFAPEDSPLSGLRRDELPDRVVLRALRGRAGGALTVGPPAVRTRTGPLPR